MRKILFSPGFGAGWSTWMERIPPSFTCEYKPIIDAIERGEYLTESSPVVVEFIEECKRKFNVEEVFVGGIEGLSIGEIDNDEFYIVIEKDGHESVKIQSESREENWY